MAIFFTNFCLFVKLFGQILSWYLLVYFKVPANKCYQIWVRWCCQWGCVELMSLTDSRRGYYQADDYHLWSVMCISWAMYGGNIKGKYWDVADINHIYKVRILVELTSASQQCMSGLMVLWGHDKIIVSLGMWGPCLGSWTHIKIKCMYLVKPTMF